MRTLLKMQETTKLCADNAETDSTFGGRPIQGPLAYEHPSIDVPVVVCRWDPERDVEMQEWIERENVLDGGAIAFLTEAGVCTVLWNVKKDLQGKRFCTFYGDSVESQNANTWLELIEWYYADWRRFVRSSFLN